MRKQSKKHCGFLRIENKQKSTVDFCTTQTTFRLPQHDLNHMIGADLAIKVNGLSRESSVLKSSSMHAQFMLSSRVGSKYSENSTSIWITR